MAKIETAVHATAIIDTNANKLAVIKIGEELGIDVAVASSLDAILLGVKAVVVDMFLGDVAIDVMRIRCAERQGKGGRGDGGDRDTVEGHGVLLLQGSDTAAVALPV
ncbi:MAG: hypothetical protein AAFQ42_12230 [Pseudomonadota bacterium]